MVANEIELADIQRLARSDSPDLAEAVVTFLKQPDPTPEKAPPAGALTVQGLMGALQAPNLRWSGSKKRRTTKHEAWKRFLAQTEPVPPPRFELAGLLVDLYERDTDAGRAALLEIIQRADLRFGLWAGLKRIYKLAEARMDAEMFGALAWRFDTEFARPQRNEVTVWTLLYLRRRAWRFLRELGAAVPELYPQFATQVLRHYTPATPFHRVWIANHVWNHDQKKYNHRIFKTAIPADMLKHRAFDEAWKRSADPLMYLLETCQADPPARFAIQSLRKDFPDKLRNVTPAWLDRLARRPLESVHEFLIETLQGSPEFHQGRLRALGLHDTVVALLTSPSAKARTYAIEYARAHAQDLAPGHLADLIESAPQDTRDFATKMLQGRNPRELGYAFLGRLVGLSGIAAWATKALNESFDRKEIPEAFLADMVYGSYPQRGWVEAWLKAKYQPGELGPDLWKRVLDDPRAKDNYQATNAALQALGKYAPKDIGVAWLLDALTRPNMGSTVAQWLQRAEDLPGLDVERVKGLVFHPAHRHLALEILGNTKLVKPRDLSLPWLLALARRADPQLHDFAHRYLLEHMKPADFAESGDRDAGIEKLFALATGPKEPDPVRAFAQTYLRCHHPVIGPDQAETKSLQLKPQLPREAYTAARVWPALADARPDVRKFAVAITRAELRAWGYQLRVYELAESDAKEVRNIAYDAILKAGEPNADKACTLTREELDAARIFALTESRKKSTREVAMEAIRRNYALLGGAERLAWIMESPDREVRLFAVRLLWEKHRPRNLPPGWKPRGKNAAALDDAGRFADVAAMQGFLRRILFGLPPGRMERRDDAGPRRHIPASVAKRNVIEVVRDIGVEDSGFARVVAPVLGEFTGSLARGEWQACLAALMHLRRAHPDLETLVH